MHNNYINKIGLGKPKLFQETQQTEHLRVMSQKVSELLTADALLLASLWRCSFSTSGLRYIDPIQSRHLGLSVLISSI